jgi:hypothetical protein
MGKAHATSDGFAALFSRRPAGRACACRRAARALAALRLALLAPHRYIAANPNPPKAVLP